MNAHTDQPSSMMQIFLVLSAPFLWASVIALTLITSSLIVISYPVVTLYDPKRRLLHRYTSTWAKSIAAIVPRSHYEIIGRENLPPKDKSVVFVANHTSQTDIVALFLLDSQFRFIAKRSLFKLPIFGWALWALGYVPVDRQNLTSKKISVKKSLQVLESGVSMLFFPEGTRSPDGKLRPFRNGAFSVAKECKVDVVPITLVGTNTFLPKGSIVPGEAQLKIIVHPPISSADKSVAELAQASRAAIVSALPAALCENTSSSIPDEVAT